MTHDRISGGGYPIEYKFLSAMLGVLRLGITIAVAICKGWVEAARAQPRIFFEEGRLFRLLEAGRHDDTGQAKTKSNDTLLAPSGVLLQQAVVYTSSKSWETR